MLRRLLPRIGPYLLVEIVLPGGTLFALLLYLYQLGLEHRAGRTSHLLEVHENSD